jgi:hypothetical protein
MINNYEQISRIVNEIDGYKNLIKKLRESNSITIPGIAWPEHLYPVKDKVVFDFIENYFLNKIKLLEDEYNAIQERG